MEPLDPDQFQCGIECADRIGCSPPIRHWVRHAVLFAGTFWAFVREFSPIELREGRDEKDIWADWERC